ncbi:MAG: hypothetical protein JF600_02775 [Xanthomonadales bacterium]|jgi:hypothetical protein|nr:hypothetical protein [Xanthomonadales bacterium]
MSYTSEQLAALERALATGEQRVNFGDRTVEYRSIDDLIAAIGVVRHGLEEQAIAAGTVKRRPRRVVVNTDKAT